MDYDTPLGESLIEDNHMIGGGPRPGVPRPQQPGEGLAYGVLLTAACGKGKVAFIDTDAAESAPGVLIVWTYKTAPKQADPSPETVPQLYSAEVMHHGEAIALVVAESFEQARAASLLIDVQYETADGAYNFTALTGTAIKPPEGMFKPDTAAGDFDTNFSAAPVQLDATYTTPNQSQAMMEPHATLAVWEGDAVTLYTAAQMANPSQKTIAATLEMPPTKVRVVARYIGIAAARENRTDAAADFQSHDASESDPSTRTDRGAA